MTDVTILYSGGLDSLIMYNYAVAHGYTPLCLHVDLGQPYGDKERATFNIVDQFHPKVEVIHMSGLYELISSRLSNQIIPSRNVMLSVIGSMFSGEVWLGALDGEQLGKEHDKSPRFFEEISNLLTYTNEMFQPRTLVKAPFAEMSKSETIAWALDYGIPLSVLVGTSSCYSDTEHKCGECLTCVKRFLAFKANGIVELGYSKDPLQSDYYKELLVEIPKAYENKDFSRFTPKRCEEFLRGLNEV